MNGLINFIILIFIIFFGSFCSSRKPFSEKPSKSISNPDSDLLEVNAVAYHTNDSTTAVFLEIINENLIYKRPDTSSSFYADTKISYKLLVEQGSKKIIDSSSYNINNRATENFELKSITSKFNLKAKRQENYYLDIQITDLNKKIKYTKGLNIYKKNNLSEQNFLITKNNLVSFKKNLLKNETVVVTYNNPELKQITVNYFIKEFGPARPPFSIQEADEFKYKPDSTIKINLTENEFKLIMPEQGFIHVTADESQLEGLTLFTYDITFPGVSNSDEMINCTRYIMNKEEFETCKNAEDKKAAIDNFWITIAGSKERARELLKRYYGRVKEANKYYSSYTQGWKTDRGIIYIVFGPPTSVYKNKNNETWVYGIESNPNSVHFNFIKTKNPFSDNDYIIERSVYLKDPYYTAVDYWRQGRIYLQH